MTDNQRDAWLDDIRLLRRAIERGRLTKEERESCQHLYLEQPMGKRGGEQYKTGRWKKKTKRFKLWKKMFVTSTPKEWISWHKYILAHEAQREMILKRLKPKILIAMTAIATLIYSSIGELRAWQIIALILVIGLPLFLTDLLVDLYRSIFIQRLSDDTHLEKEDAYYLLFLKDRLHHLESQRAEQLKVGEGLTAVPSAATEGEPVLVPLHIQESSTPKS